MTKQNMVILWEFVQIVAVGLMKGTSVDAVAEVEVIVMKMTMTKFYKKRRIFKKGMGLLYGF